MKKLTIAFDVDGTLVKNDGQPNGRITANERVRRMLIDLAHSKNVKIIVWSGGGELWARQAAKEIGVAPYVNQYADKQYQKCDRPECVAADNPCQHHSFGTDLKPDIAFDDIQDCTLGIANIIVREK